MRWAERTPSGNRRPRRRAAYREAALEEFLGDTPPADRREAAEGIPPVPVRGDHEEDRPHRRIRSRRTLSRPPDQPETHPEEQAAEHQEELS